MLNIFIDLLENVLEIFGKNLSSVDFEDENSDIYKLSTILFSIYMDKQKISPIAENSIPNIDNDSIFTENTEIAENIKPQKINKSYLKLIHNPQEKKYTNHKDVEHVMHIDSINKPKKKYIKQEKTEDIKDKLNKLKFLLNE